MDTSPPKGRKRKISDEELRACVGRNMTGAEIARAYKCSEANVSQRLKALNLSTASALTAPVESRRFVRQSLGVMEQLAKNLVSANLLLDACDEWLRDADDATKYDLGPRGQEVLITYYVESEDGKKREARKEPLDVLLRRLELLADMVDDRGVCAEVGRSEYKHADPRELILKTQAETRQTAALIMDAIQKVTNAKIMEDFRLACIEEIGKESSDCARRIAERLQSILVLHAAFAGPGALGAGAGEAAN